MEYLSDSPFVELEQLFASRGSEALLPVDQKRPDDPIQLRTAGYTDFVRLVAQGHIDDISATTRSLAERYLAEMRGP